jgi:23S rRNA (cytosine1962-C5)-methyltransferase
MQGVDGLQTATPRVPVQRAAAELIEKGFLWVYRDRLAGQPHCAPGDLVQVEGPQGRILGTAYYSAGSKIALRMLTRGASVPDEAELLRERLDAARRLRDRLLPGFEARRLVYSDSDGLPGLVVDQYADALVVQTLTQAADRRQELLLELLQAQLAPRQIVLRNDVRVRGLEGLPLYRKALLQHDSFEVEVRHGSIRQVVDLWEGQKTGTFLDQQENHHLVGQLARGRVLDLFSYSGGFALHAAPAAEQVVAVDSSQAALALAEQSAGRSGLTNIEWVCSNVFDYIRDAAGRGERFDTVVIDPPAFAKRRSDLPAAQRAYRDLNRRALALLADSGVLVTCSCSYNLSEADLVGLVRQAAESAGRSLALVERRSQSRDHPESLGLPESRYLKCLVLAAG